MRKNLIVENGWSEWTAWSKCTTTCGRGYHYRVRACKSRDTSLCVGKPVEYETCELMKCPRKNLEFKISVKTEMF